MRIKNAIAEIARTRDNFYLYDEVGIAAQIERLKGAFPSLELLYSVKCNPNRRVLDAVFERGLGADVASVGEVFAARDAGLNRDRIYFSAPGKTTDDVAATVNEATIIADSLSEIERIDRVAAERGRVVEFGSIRILRSTAARRPRRSSESTKIKRWRFCGNARRKTFASSVCTSICEVNRSTATSWRGIIGTSSRRRNAWRSG